MELKEAILSTLAEMQEDAPSSVIKAEEIGEIDEAPNENRHIEPPQLHNLSSVELDANEVLESIVGAYFWLESDVAHCLQYFSDVACSILVCVAGEA